MDNTKEDMKDLARQVLGFGKDCEPSDYVQFLRELLELVEDELAETEAELAGE